jgi:hypothetical protein
MNCREFITLTGLGSVMVVPSISGAAPVVATVFVHSAQIMAALCVRNY